MRTQDQSFEIPKSWLLLDTCSTCNVSNNPSLVTHVFTCTPDEVLLAYTHVGAQKFEQLAELRTLPVTLKFKRDSVATILSLKIVSEISGARLMTNTQIDKNITLTLKDGRVFVFFNTRMDYIILTQTRN